MQDVQENVILNLLIQYSFFFLQKLWKLSTQKIFWRPLTQIDGKRGTYNFAPKKNVNIILEHSVYMYTRYMYEWVHDGMYAYICLLIEYEHLNVKCLILEYAHICILYMCMYSIIYT